MSVRLKRDFFLRDINIVARQLIGKIIVRKFETMKEERFRITEIEIYVGEEDLASHASKGRTKRTEVIYSCGGYVYVYLIYGIYWLLNIVTGKKDQAQAILVRGVEGIDGPGKIGQQLKLDKSFYGEDLESSNRIWMEDDGMLCNYTFIPELMLNMRVKFGKISCIVIKLRKQSFNSN
ncbi:DNA-3-methyladenine glycosylase [Labilibaculum sp. K2S]|uniref:DNA-3-methyladenine glycosylase n=1 Tax=Labilibaculum sp. K2S TaxID=3056386 RepID=UPI0025A4AE99|nr:DNA-3-methyladenine glycosylase [Labilibaculum sp. K2S]MDM8159297.1 DNA-3-methyladenine glycosylase [Labilibaculum sp. K2S]